MAAAAGINSRGARQRARNRPRSRASTGGGGKIHWDRLGRVLLVIAILVVLANYVQPVSNYLGQRSAAQRDRAELKQLQQQNRGLRLQLLEMHDSRAIAARARRLGMVLKGERPYVIEGAGR